MKVLALAHPVRVLMMAQAVAYWPVWWWYVQRMTDGSDEPYGIAALLTAVAIACRQRCARPLAIGWAPFACLAVYAAGHRLLPQLLLGLIAVLGIGISISRCWLGRRLHAGFIGLLVLSLPIIATIQFYCGYPLRLLTAAVSAALLRCAGSAVRAEGTILHWCGELIVVDAPCSGVRMLWTGLYLVFALACVARLSPWRTWVSYASALPIILTGNILRSTLLFYIESGKVNAPSAAHSIIGLVIFAIVAAAIVAINRRLVSAKTNDLVPSSDPVARPTPPLRRPWAVAGAGALALLASVAAAVRPGQEALTPGSHDRAFPGWPTHFAGRPLQQLTLSDREQRFSAGFPGHIGRFTDGQRELILRWIERPSRRVHPARHCLRGSGYSVRPLSLRAQADGTLWGATAAERPGDHCRVYERIWSTDGGSWSDVSAWYWAAALGRSTGPWWSAVVIESAPAR